MVGYAPILSAATFLGSTLRFVTRAMYNDVSRPTNSLKVSFAVRIACHFSKSQRYFAALITVAWVNSSSPSWPNSTPMPDCFAPPNGVSSLISKCLFTQTMPALILAAISNARSRSWDQTELPNPNPCRWPEQ